MKDIAARLGADKDDVSEFLRGDSNMSLGAMYLLADALAEPEYHAWGDSFMNALSRVQDQLDECRRQRDRSVKDWDILLNAICAITKSILQGDQDNSKNPYSNPTVKAALKAIANATGKSSFGNDWMSALDQFEGKAP